MDSGGSKDILSVTFDGRPSNYREFRRKTILAIAGLEEKHVHLAGPRLLARLQGEAWRATEHIGIAELRRPEGWLTVIRALDRHYKFLPVTELHEAIVEFLFLLKRRQNEGATSFSSRFKAQMDRVQTLIAQERDGRKKKRRKTKHANTAEQEDSPESSLEDSEHDGSDQARASPTSEAAAEERAFPEAREQAPADSEDDPRRTSRSSKQSDKGSGYGTHKADLEKKQRVMQQLLGALEPGHLRVKPIFPQSVLGHLFMRKFGLSRDQRAQVIRSTNGSSRLRDVERILRASDLEESRPDDKRQPRPVRREVRAAEHQAMAMDEESSATIDFEEESSDSSHDVLELNDDETDQELHEMYELQGKAKDKFRKTFKNGYKEEGERAEAQPSTLFACSGPWPACGWQPAGSHAFAEDLLQV